MAVSRKKRKTRKKKNEEKTTKGLIAVLSILLVIGVGAYYFKDNIGVDRSNTDRNPIDEPTETAAGEPAVGEPSEETPIPEEPSVTVVRTEETPKPAPEKAPEPQQPVSQKTETQQTPKPERRPDTKTNPITPQIKTEEKQLFFVRYSESTESVEIVPVIRRISYESSPLTQTLNTLLYGPNVSELSRNLVTMIPDKTKILSIKINTGIATINFNEAFMFNSNGREGTEAQLAQIVYTATQFPTVSAVQFLIEGEKKTYMPDGSYIELPLSRSSF